MTGEELTPWLIRYAYEQGAFPMTVDDEENEVEWFQPRVRALFPIEGIHLSRSMKRVLSRCSTPQPPSSVSGQVLVSVGATNRKTEEGGFVVTFDEAFADVMRSCMRPGENWISEDFIRVYSEIHEQGWGHSCEVWATSERAFIDGAPMLHPRFGFLVGGLYGIALGSCFCAESMFHRATNASKVALWAMVEHCRELGFTMFDAQVMNPHLASLGAKPVRHEKYMEMLADALSRQTAWSR